MELVRPISDKKNLYFCNDKEFMRNNIKIWEKNRLVDYTRVSELTAMYKKDDYQIVPGWLSAFMKDDQMYVYDGSHRFQAMISSGRTMSIFITITQFEKVIDDFINVNKMVPIPECYLSENDATQLSERIVKHYCNLYPKFVSPSFRCRKPNFNRDNFIDLLSTHLKGKDMQFDNVILKLNEFNDILKDNVKNTKCKKYNFWLFTVPTQELIKYI